MTIAKRLALLIAVAVIGLILVGIVGLRQMSAINGNLQYAHENSIPSIKKVDAMEASFLRIRINANAFMVANEEQRPNLEARMNKRRAELEQHLKDYEPLISDDKDRQYLETSKALLKDYLPLLDNMISATKAGQLDKARAGMTQASELSTKVSENMEAHAKYNEDLAEQEVKKAADAYSSGKTGAILVILLAAAVTGALGFAVYRHVDSSLGAMVGMFTRIETSLDFTGRLPVKGTDEVAQAAGAFNRLLEKLQHSLREISRHTEEVATAANQVATASNQMTIASSQQSEAASSMAATMEQMTVSINHVADRAGEANQASTTSGAQARHGETIIGQTVHGINSISDTVHAAASQIAELEQHSERINNVVAVIKEVADQTNLLALNAAIEAARAGEQGRGFAVVADEVRKLAERTSQSTQEIGTTILAMQSSSQSAVRGIQQVVERVTAGVTTAEEANTAIQAIGASSRSAVDMVADISDAIREQSMASTNIAQQVERIAQMAEENSSASQSTSDSAGELAQLARQMQNVVGQYRV